MFQAKEFKKDRIATRSARVDPAFVLLSSEYFVTCATRDE